MYEEDSERTLMDIIEGARISDPMEVFIGRESMYNIETRIGEVLSELEAEVLRHYIQGKSYSEIAAEMKRDVKSIDNALQRVKKKLEPCLE